MLPARRPKSKGCVISWARTCSLILIVRKVTSCICHKLEITYEKMFKPENFLVALSFFELVDNSVYVSFQGYQNIPTAMHK